MTEKPQIIYIHPAKQGVGFPFADPRHSYLTPFTLLPAGVTGLVNLLRREGLSVRGVNYPSESFITPGFGLAEWLRHVGTPRLALIDLHWYEHSFGALDVARVCKQTLPGTSVIVGGMTASLYAREILDGFPYVDYVIRGDAEEPLRQLALQFCSGDVHARNLQSVPNLSYRAQSEVIENELSYHTPAEDMDRLDLINTEYLDHARHYHGFQYVGRRGTFLPSEGSPVLGHWLSIGRGCVYDCSYCGGGHESHRLIAGRPGLVMRSVSAVVDNLEELRDRGIHQAALTLDPVIAGRAYWGELFAQMSQRHLRIGLYVELFQLPPAEFLEAFAECVDLKHSELSLSALSGDERVRRRHGKAYSNAELLGSVHAMKRQRIPLSIYYSFNLPGQDEAAMRKTLFLSESIARAVPPHQLLMYNQPHTLDPCSPMSRTPEEFGIEVRLHSFPDYFEYCRLTAVEYPGVLGTTGRGFTWPGRSQEMERRMQQAWIAFARAQKFPCG